MRRRGRYLVAVAFFKHVKLAALAPATRLLLNVAICAVHACLQVDGALHCGELGSADKSGIKRQPANATEAFKYFRLSVDTGGKVGDGGCGAAQAAQLQAEPKGVS